VTIGTQREMERLLKFIKRYLWGPQSSREQRRYGFLQTSPSLTANSSGRKSPLHAPNSRCFAMRPRPLRYSLFRLLAAFHRDPACTATQLR